MAIVKINRQQKNLMRTQIEEVLQLQKDIDKKIDTYASTTEPQEYQKFWHELKTKNQETIQKVSRYMVAKCNR